MLILALAMLIQDPPLPPVKPGLCRATAEKLEPIINAVRNTLQDDARSSSPQYPDNQRATMMRLLEEDATRVRKVKQRYAGTTPSSADVATADAMRSPVMAKYVETCAA